MDKLAVRDKYKDLRRTVPIDRENEWAYDLCNQLWSIEEVKASRRIMAYLAMPKEANLDLFIREALCRGKEVYVPHCISEDVMVPVRLNGLEQVESHMWGIRTPKEPHQMIGIEHLDMILVPGLAFDIKGGRMGMGRGYYDRFLGHTDQSKRIGIAWDFQIGDELIPMDAHDQFMGMIVTPTQYIHCCKE